MCDAGENLVKNFLGGFPQRMLLKNNNYISYKQVYTRVPKTGLEMRCPARAGDKKEKQNEA